ncbi:hypothetical protein TNCV_2053141 [Trichonephila clavipes]|nr:hypothetical protein TNCV_2053141 [Trichonephila clavipes]
MSPAWQCQIKAPEIHRGKGDSYGVVRTTIRVLSCSTTASQENQRPCNERTEVNNVKAFFERHLGELHLPLTNTSHLRKKTVPFD